jgi:hypothetical protein
MTITKKIRLFMIIGVLMFLTDCTSDLEKAKELGFNSVDQMKKLNELGYKSKDDLIQKLPYKIQTNSTKFAEAALGQNPEIFGQKKQSESGDSQWFETSNGVVLDEDTNKISKITYHCSEKFKSQGEASINGISCGESSSSIRKKLKEFKELCTTSYFDIDISYVVKEKAFFELHQKKRFGVELYSMGLVEDIKYLNNRYDDPYIDCKEAKALISKAKSSGFSSVFAMNRADEMKKNPLEYCKSEWIACSTTEMLMNNYSGVSQIQEQCEKATGMLAKWDYQFTYSPPYTSFYDSASDLKDGKLRLVDDDVKFQNGFGAWRRISVVCYYDLKTKNAYLVLEK